MSSKIKWKNQFKIIDTASKFHNTVREIFATDPFFKNLSCYQELNVRDLVPECQDHNLHYDWYIQELNTIVELHGKQHYEMTNFGNISYNQAVSNFLSSKTRDSIKKWLAIEAGYKFVEISYKEKITAERLKTLIL